MADRVVIWRFAEVTHELSRAESEFLRDRLFAERRDDCTRLGVLLRKALNGPDADLPLELSVFDGPALRAALEGVRVGARFGLTALQRDVRANPHADEAPRDVTPQSDGEQSDGEQESDEPVVVWRFDGLPEGLNRREAKILRDWLLAEPNLAWLALGKRVEEALGDADAAAPVELTLSDVHVLQGVLEAAPLNDQPGLTLLQRAARSVW